MYKITTDLSLIFCGYLNSVPVQGVAYVTGANYTHLKCARVALLMYTQENLKINTYVYKKKGCCTLWLLASAPWKV